MDPIKIYLGTQIEQSLASYVLAYSIRKHTQRPVEVTPLFQAVEAAETQIPTPRNPKLRPRTPFTFQRFAIPQICDYQGRAIYLDSDMLVLRDISEVWDQPFDNNDLLSVPEPPDSVRSPQYSVMLLNCEQLNWNAAQLVHQLEAGTYTYQQLVLEMTPASQKATRLPLGWNDLERYDAAQTALLHYTDMPLQPWLSVHNPLAEIWCEYLLAAIAEGAISRASVAASVELGWVRPSLLTQVDCQIANPKDLPETVLARDQQYFAPPHEWQRFLSRPFLQRQSIRQWFIPTYAALKRRLKPSKTQKSQARQAAEQSFPTLNVQPTKTQKAPPLYFLSVNYHSTALLAKMIGSLGNQQNVVIVNNSPEDAEVYALKKRAGGHNITIVDALGNVGFGAGCNLGLQWIYERSPDALVWLLNPDAQLIPHAIAIMRQCFRDRPDIAILGTPVLDDTGRLWFGSGQFNPWLGSVTSHKPATPDLLGWPTPTRWVSGCSMVLNLAQLGHCPKFDDSYFLYYEDCDLCERYFQKKERIALAPVPLVTHAVSSITGRNIETKTCQGTLSKLTFLSHHARPPAVWLNLVYLSAQSLLWQRSKPDAAKGRRLGIRKFLQR